MNTPFFCCGLRSIWCVLDSIHHRLPGEGTYWTWDWVCDMHDDSIMGDR